MEHCFLWLMKTLTKGKRIPVLDCYIVDNNKITSFISMNQTLKAESSDPVEILSKVYREFLLLRRLNGTSYAPCYFFNDQNREAVDIQELERYVKSGTFCRETSLIQIPKTFFKQEEFVFRFIKDKLTCFYLSTDRYKKDIKDPELCSQVMLIAKRVIRTIRKHHRKHVIQIEILFQADSNRLLWIADIKNIKLGQKIEKIRNLLQTAREMIRRTNEIYTDRSRKSKDFDRATNSLTSRGTRDSQSRISKSRAAPSNLHCSTL